MSTKHLLAAVLTAGLALPWAPNASAQIITTSSGSASPNTIIPDYDFSGLASTINLSSPIETITSVQVTVDVVGAPTAWNGDYYAYLESSSGLVVLLNQLGGPPFGSPGNGLNVTFSDSAPNISTAPGLNTTAALTGTYAPQSGNSLNGSFENQWAGGNWTLFIADEQAGGVGELASWNLQVTGAVPDGGDTLELLVMAVGGLALWSKRPRSKTSSSKPE